MVHRDVQRPCAMMCAKMLVLKTICTAKRQYRAALVAEQVRQSQDCGDQGD